MATKTESKLQKLTGEITFDTVPQLWRTTSELLANGDNVVVDLSEVKRADSSALALLIGWKRRARLIGKTIEFHNIPENILATARVTGVEAFLSSEHSAANAAPSNAH